MLRGVVPAVICCACASASIAAPMPASPMAPSAAPDCDGTVREAYISLTDVFAHEITDAPTLRFISRLAAVPESRQTTMIRAVSRADPEVAKRVRVAIALACAGHEVTYRSRRALYTMANRWTVDTNALVSPAFSDGVVAALGAIQLRDSIAPSDLAAALGAFGMRTSDVQGGTAPVEAACPKPDDEEKIRVVAQPAYPEMASRTRTTGSIRVKVRLDPDGLVKSVAVSKAEGSGPRIDALSEATVFAAAVTTYAPRIVACRPVDGEYLFRAVFTGT